MYRPTETRPTLPWCLFRVESRPYAVGLESVAEVVEAEGLVRLPLVTPRVLGLCVFHRDVIPVIALDPPGGNGVGDGPDARPLVLILRAETGTWGLRIDRVGTAVAEAALEPAAVATPGHALRGTVRALGADHDALDPEATWRRLRDEVQRWTRGDPGPSPALFIPENH